MRFSLVHILAIKLAAVLLAFAGAPLAWALTLFFGADLWVLYHLFVPGASGLLRTFTHFQTGRPEVWLTIDDGPDAHDTPRILEALDRHDARATFFLVGEHAARHPALVSEITRRGHEVAHHTHTHPDLTFWCASPSRLHREIDLGLAALAASGVRPVRFRPPVGIKNLFLKRALSERGLDCIAWNRRSRDSIANDPDRVVARLINHVRPGDILLMHEGSRLHANVRVAALEKLLAALSARGIRCVIPAASQLR